ncbi:MAG: Stp1/IreP family PP2C-type Ser/Thr phosphatase [Deltaproteobacteria bacterium]|nr:Stp1/IreP family PP2C-type Ser/Thr phosphatase [Deltaproteobacteria bacterium]
MATRKATSKATTPAASADGASTGAEPAAPTKRAAPRSYALETCATTDVGLVREGNEDAFLVSEEEQLYVVADGMGGHSAGEVASAFTIEALRAFYGNDDLTKRVQAAYRRMRRAGHPIPEGEASHHALRLRKAVESANITVFRLAQQHEQLRDMGTTVVAAVFAGRNVHIANVGDSRLYRLRKHKLTQLTEDHSLLNEYLRMNLLQPDEVEAFPYKNVIVRALGLQEAVAVDIFGFTVRRGDTYVLCSDGLTDLVRDAEIGAVLGQAPTARAACVRLTDMAKARGGHDNITVLVIKVHAPGWQPAAPTIPPPPPGLAPGAIPPPPQGAAPVHIPPPPSGPAPVD